MADPVIGPNFGNELLEAGIVGWPFTWGPEGLQNTEKLTPDQLEQVQAVIAKHDPTIIPEGYWPPLPKNMY